MLWELAQNKRNGELHGVVKPHTHAVGKNKTGTVAVQDSYRRLKDGAQ